MSQSQPPVCEHFYLTWCFASCNVVHYPRTCYTETRFGDGMTVAASPEDTTEYKEKAKRLGYSYDTCRMSKEHELLHTFTAHKLGQPCSPTLWAVAHGFNADAPEHLQEEEYVCAFAAYLNGVGVSWHPDWPQWAIEARSTLFIGRHGA